MPIYLYNGPNVTIESEKNLVVKDVLDPKVYNVKFNAFRECYYLVETHFTVPTGRIYGDYSSRVDRILKTFDQRPYGTGILFSGDKGSGKTLTATMTITKALEQGHPVLMVEDKFKGAGFTEFINSITQPALVVWDEFEKKYDYHEQETMLTLFDGAIKTKKLFLVVVNDKWRISDYMVNRPGRFFYHFSYEGVDESVIKEYCEVNLKDQSRVVSVINITKIIPKFNMDMLKALVEEMNRYNETVQEALQYLNIRADNSETRYKVLRLIDENGVQIPITEDLLVNNGNTFNLSSNCHIYFTPSTEGEVVELSKAYTGSSNAVVGYGLDDCEEVDETDDGSQQQRITFSASNIVSMSGGVIQYRKGKAFAEIKQIPNDKFDYLKHLL